MTEFSRNSDGIRRRAATPRFLRRRKDEEFKEPDVFVQQESVHSAQSYDVESRKQVELHGPGSYEIASGKWMSKIHVTPVRWGIAAAGGIVMLIVILLSTVFVRVTIAVKPRVEEFMLSNIEVLLETKPHERRAEERGIAAEVLTFSRTVSREFEATGRGSGVGKSRGMVKLYNNFSTAPQTIVARTRLATDSGAVYRLASAVAIPGAKAVKGILIPQFVEAEAVAEIGGEKGNLAGEIKMKIPGFQGTPRNEKIYAVAPFGFSGGWSGEARVVSKDDRVRSEETVTKEVFDALRREMANKLPPDFMFAEGLREIKIIKVKTPGENTRHDRFVAEAAAEGRMMIFRRRDLIALLENLLIPSHAATVVEDSFAPAFRIVSLDFSKGTARLGFDGNVKAQNVVSKNDLIELAKGKKEAALIEALRARAEVSTFQLQFFPPWRSKVPYGEDKIKIVVQ